MLDFFLILGQVPGTHFYLTFTEVFCVYTISLSAFYLNREYRSRTSFYTYMKFNYAMFSSRVRPGRIKRREVLPVHIDLAPLVDIDVELILERLQDFGRLVRLNGERILQLGSSLRRPTDDAF
jgi:hypothetical protein